MNLTLKKSSFFCIWLAVVFIFSQQCLYLLPESPIFKIITYILVLIFWAYTFLHDCRIKITTFGMIMVSTILLSLMASIVEVIMYDDANFFISFFQQAKWWIFAFVYFGVAKLLRNNKITSEQLIKLIIVLSTIQLIIGIGQYILSDYINFVYVSNNTRYGKMRYYYPIILMILSLFISLNEIFNNSKDNKKSIILVCAVLIEITVVQKFRSTLVGVGFAIFIGYLCWKKNVIKKVLYGLLCMFIIAVIFSKGTIIQDTLNSLLNNSDNSLGVRSYLINFLVENFKQNFIWGSGWISSDQAYYYASTPYRTKLDWNVFAFSDGGIFSFMYAYGIFGVMWIFATWGTMIKYGYKIMKVENNYIYFLYPIYMLVTMYIDIHWYIHMQFFTMAIFCALGEHKYNNLRKKI